MTEKPRRVQLSRKKGWRMPENTVSVARPGKWGNPFTVEEEGSAEEAVDMFEHDLDKASCFHPEEYRAYIMPLVGKNLACWCKPGDPCHADALLRRAAEYEDEASHD